MQGKEEPTVTAEEQQEFNETMGKICFMLLMGLILIGSSMVFQLEVVR